MSVLLLFMLCSCGPGLQNPSVDAMEDGWKDEDGGKTADGGTLSLAVSFCGGLEFSPAQGDRIGVDVLYGRDAFLLAGCSPDNVPFTYDGRGWNPESELEFTGDGVVADVCCRYPWSGDKGSGDAFIVRAQADQSTPEGYRGSSRFYGKSRRMKLSEAPLEVEMWPLMSRLSLVIKAGDGWTADEVASVSVSFCGLDTAAEVRLDDGGIVCTSEKADILPLGDGDATWSALVVPQTVSDAVLARITAGDDEYEFRTSVVLERGKHRACTLVLNRTGGKFGVGVGGWETGGDDYGGTAD